MSTNGKKPAATVVYEYILAGLISRRYPPGTPMREERFCEECGCSATPVREAFRQLEKEGWLTNLPYRGCLVRVLSRAEIEELYYLREAIEGQAVRIIIERDYRDAVAALGDALTAMERELEAGGRVGGRSDALSAVAFIPNDLGFHRVLLETARLSGLARYAGQLDYQLRTFVINEDEPVSRQRRIEIFEEHRDIYNAIRRGWQRSAEGLICDHIASSRRRILEQYDQSEAAAKARKPRKQKQP